ncbi:MAG: hypothetical protein AAGA90_14550 [Actinomycetota bacterium]
MAHLERVDVMASMWLPDRPERTRIGRLVEAAKDRGDDAAVALLAQEAADWAAAPDGDTVVVPVPPSPDRPNRLVPAVADALAARWQVPRADLVERHGVTPRLRDLDPADRRGVAIAGDYRLATELDPSVAVVLVDDVILTGVTLEHVAGVVRAGGGRPVRAAVLARSRRA